MRVQVCQVGDEELVEARRPTIQPAEAISARVDVHDRLNLSVHQEFVSEDPVKIEQIEEQQAVLIETSVSKQHVNVKIRNHVCRIRNGRKAEPCRLITGIEIVVQVIHSGQSLVDILGREVDAVIVIPERAHRFVYV